mgnify:CR=1 FL=1
MTLPLAVRAPIPIRKNDTAPALAEIVHDLNNALSTVVGFSELMLDKPDLMDDRETALRYLEAIRIAGRDASQMVTGLQSGWWPATNPATFDAPDQEAVDGRERRVRHIDY